MAETLPSDLQSTCRGNVPEAPTRDWGWTFGWFYGTLIFFTPAASTIKSKITYDLLWTQITELIDRAFEIRIQSIFSFNWSSICFIVGTCNNFFLDGLICFLEPILVLLKTLGIAKSEYQCNDKYCPNQHEINKYIMKYFYPKNLISHFLRMYNTQKIIKIHEIYLKTWFNNFISYFIR